MTLPVAPLEASVLAALRAVLLDMFDPATSLVGSASGTTMSVSSVKTGAVTPNMAIVGPNVLPGTVVQQFLTGRGGPGTYMLSQAISQTAPQGSTFLGGFDVVRGQVNRVASPAAPDYAVMWPLRQRRLGTNDDTLADVKFTAAIAGETMTVSAVAWGALSVGATVWGANVAAGTRIIALGTGAGGPGTYLVSPSQTVASETMACGALASEQPTEMTIQIDVHGPSSADNATRISTLFRDDYAVEAFAAVGTAVVPLHADDPRQVPFVNDQDQYENRWIVEACVQVNSVVSVPQQFADTAVVGIISVDVEYPA